MLKRFSAFILSLVIIALLIPSLPAMAAVSLVTQWQGTANSTTTPLAVTTSTTNGDLLVAVAYIQASPSCPTLTAASGWTKSADSTCTSSKHDIAIFTHTATGETSDTPIGSLSVAANQNIVIYEFSGANTSTPIDVSSFAAMAASTTPATPNVTTTQNGDYLLAAWGTASGTATASSITAGWTQINNNNSVFEATGSKSQATAGAVTGPTVTYGTAPSSGVVGTIAIAPAGGAAAPVVQSTCIVNPAGQATSAAIGSGCTLTTGDLVFVTVTLDTSTSTTITPPAGTWTKVDQYLVSPIQVAVFWHVIQSGETSYTFSWGSTSMYYSIKARDVSGANTTTPVDAFAHNNTTSSLTATTASITPSQTDLGLADFANTHNSSTPSAATGWTNEYTVSTSASVYMAGQNDGAFSTAGSATATYTGTAPPLIIDEILAIAPTSGGSGGGPGPGPSPNNLPLTHAGGHHISVALSGGGGGGSGVAPEPDWMTWFNQLFGSNDHISATHQSQWLDYCNGGGTSTSQVGGDSGGASITGCPHAYDYTSFNIGEPSTSGSDNDLPWTGNFTNATGQTCPSAATSGNYWASSGTDSPNWTSTSNSTNWFMYASTIGSASDRVVSYSSTYRLFTNLNSTNMSSAVSDMLQKCAYRGIDLNTYEGWWNDNAYIGLTAANWLPWGPFAYNTAINWGSNGGTLSGGGYASTNCNGSSGAMFNGSICKQSSQISGSSSSGNATYGADSGGVGAVTTAWQSFVPALKHRDGTSFKFMYNDLINGMAACQMNNQVANVTGGTLEFATTKGAADGRYQGPNEMLNIIDIAATDYACGGAKFLMLDDFDHTTISGKVTNDATIGTQDFESQKRIHWGMEWLLWSDTHPQMMVSWTLGCGSCTSFTDVWAANFVAPSGRITAYPAEAFGAGSTYCGENFSNDAGTNSLCSTGGARDAAMQATCPGGSPNCVFRTEFNHWWVWNATSCPTYNRANWSTCAHDIGPAAVLVNLSGQTVTLSTTNLQAWLPNTYSSLLRVLTLCTPNSSYFGTSGSDIYANQNTTTSVCSSGASDLFNGSSLGSTDLASEIGTTLSNDEVVVLTAGTP